MEIEERELREYIPVYDFVYKKLKLKGITKEVYSLIYSYTENNNTYCFSSLGNIAKRIGGTKKSIWEALEELKYKGLIIAEEKSIYSTNNYRTTPLEEITEEMVNRKYKRIRNGTKYTTP